MKKFTLYSLVILILSMTAFSSSDKELVRLSGTVEQHGLLAASWTPVFSSQPVEDADWIRTQEASEARLDFHGGKQSAMIYERTILRVDGIYPDKVSLLQSIGKIEVVVRHLFEKPFPVEVTTPTAVMAVKGSAADCEVIHDGTTYVTGLSGHIEVSALGKTIAITGGQAVVVRPGNIPQLLSTPILPKIPNNLNQSNVKTNPPASTATSARKEFSSPPPGTTSTLNPNGTTTYTYVQQPGTAAPQNIPPGAVRSAIPSQPIGPVNFGVKGAPSIGTANIPMTGYNPPVRSTIPGYMSGLPQGVTVNNNNNNGTITFTYIQQAGAAPPSSIPLGATKTVQSDGSIKYTLTTTR